MRVSTLILTFNEEQNLPSCLSALAWCDDILVLDSGSTDRTVEIARAHGVRVISRTFDNFAGQRNYGLDCGELQYEWVLHLDADEIVTPSFSEQLLALNPIADIDAWRVPSKLMLAGRWLRHAGMYPTYQVRIGHRDRLRFVQVGHGQREDLSPDRVATFSEPYLHYNFSHGLPRWFEKHIRYARDEAAFIMHTRVRTAKAATGVKGTTEKRRALKSLAARLPLWSRPFARAFYILIVRQGLRDGPAGLMYTLMLAVYEGMIAVFTYEAMLGGVGPKSTRTDA